MSHWTSKYAILQDLSMVQGRVPVAVEGILRAGDKPPSLNIIEDTEEEFFDKCSDEGEVAAAPDYKLIQRMLDMVRGTDISSDDEDGTNKEVVISKLNPESKPFVPMIMQSTSSPVPKPTVKKPKRNVALESILQAISENRQIELFNTKPEPIRLLKPNDFISTPETVIENLPDNNIAFNHKAESDVVESVEKVKDWLETQTVIKQPIAPKKAKPVKVNLEVSNMFKKKSSNSSIQVKVDNQSVKGKSKESNGVYVPSTLANEYYQKFVEQNKLAQSVKEDIWSRAEKKMREIEETRNNKAAQVGESPVTPSVDSGTSDTSNHTTADHTHTSTILL